MDTKVNDTTLEIKTIIPEREESTQYSIGFLLQEKANTLQAIESENSRHIASVASLEAEVARLQDLIDRAEAVGIVTEVAVENDEIISE